MKQKFTVVSRKIVFRKGPILVLDCKIRLPSKRMISRQILDHPGSVVIIAKTSRNRYLMVRQFRFAAERWLWEFPAGGVEKRESFKSAASRELIEETGFHAGKMSKLMRLYPSPGISSECMHLFMASKLTPAYAKGDEDEEISVASFSSKQIQRMIFEGKIIDAKTIAGFLFVQKVSNF